MSQNLDVNVAVHCFLLVVICALGCDAVGGDHLSLYSASTSQMRSGGSWERSVTGVSSETQTVLAQALPL